MPADMSIGRGLSTMGASTCTLERITLSALRATMYHQVRLVGVDFNIISNLKFEHDVYLSKKYPQQGAGFKHVIVLLKFESFVRFNIVFIKIFVYKFILWVAMFCNITM